MKKGSIATENEQLRQENYVLRERISQLERMIFGARRERFLPAINPAQGLLFEEAPIALETERQEEETSPKSSSANKTKKGRKSIKRNTFPAHLLREEQLIEADTSGMENPVKIGEDVTELLAYKPAEIQVKKIIRPRYADQSDENKGVVQAPIPLRLIPKGMVDESLVAQIIVDKIVLHLPVYRFAKKLRLLGIDFIKQNNLHNWLHRGASALLPLYNLLEQEVVASGYIQADETHIKVLAKNKVGASHRGQMWVYFSPEKRLVLFNYEPTRSEAAATEIVGTYEGFLQCDGYSVYQALAEKRKEQIQLTHCMAHARRKFYDAKESEPELAGYFLAKVQQLYELEQQARDEQLGTEQRLTLRQTKAIPILEELKEWLLDKSGDRTLLPKSMIRKAIDYTLRLWEGLSTYALHGRLEIDNNLVENTIRPVAIGRKNYLFAGSHEAAQNLAVLYSIVGSCEKNNINPYLYLNWILRKMATEKVTPQAVEWLPHRVNPELFEQWCLGIDKTK